MRLIRLKFILTSSDYREVKSCSEATSRALLRPGVRGVGGEGGNWFFGPPENSRGGNYPPAIVITVTVTLSAVTPPLSEVASFSSFPEVLMTDFLFPASWQVWLWSFSPFHSIWKTSVLYLLDLPFPGMRCLPVSLAAEPGEALTKHSKGGEEKKKVLGVAGREFEILRCRIRTTTCLVRHGFRINGDAKGFR